MNNALRELTLVRFREFFREPEALFWVFLFPVLLAAGLGIAFRNRPAEVLTVGVTGTELARSLRQEKLLNIEEYSPENGAVALRTGKIALLVVSADAGKVEYRYDDTNPEGRTAHMLADRAIQRAAGRVDPLRSEDRILREPGSRYIDFFIPGLLGMNLMGSAIWGMGFAIVDARRKKLMKLLVATPMPKHYFLLSFVLSRLVVLVIENHSVDRLCCSGIRSPNAWIAARVRCPLRSGLHDILCHWASNCRPPTNHRGGLGSHEPGDGANVDPLRGILLLTAISRSCSTRNKSAAADRDHRCSSRQHAPGGEPRRLPRKWEF